MNTAQYKHLYNRGRSSLPLSLSLSLSLSLVPSFWGHENGQPGGLLRGAFEPRTPWGYIALGGVFDANLLGGEGNRTSRYIFSSYDHP